MKINSLKIALKFLYFSKKHDICTAKNRLNNGMEFQIKVSKIVQMEPHVSFDELNK